MPPTQTCLCLLTRDFAGAPEVLLGLKKTGLGTGNLVGLGGHLEPGETARQTAVREAFEETGIRVSPTALRHLAHITYRFPARPARDQTVAIFTGERFSGVPVETAEITPRWCPTAAPPLDGMWDDARYWLPQVLAGRRLRAEFEFAADCATVAEHRVYSDAGHT